MSNNTLSREVITTVINACNTNLINDRGFDPAVEHPNQWFIRQFNFMDNSILAEHLGEAFYQARFICMLMEKLNLPMLKNKGIIKFQIIQYASICEALINFVISKHFLADFQKTYERKKYTPVAALAKDTVVSYQGNDIKLCIEKTEKASIDDYGVPNKEKTHFAVEKGILSNRTGDEYCNLYGLRNNAHILKAVSTNYFPKLKEGKAAYELTWRLIGEVRKFCQANP